MADKNFTIGITATDKASAVFKKLNANAAKAVRPAADLEKKFKAQRSELAEISKGLDRAAKSMGGLAKIGESFGLRVPMLGGLSGGLAVGAGVQAFASMMRETSAKATGVMRFTSQHGVSGRSVQRLTAAAQRQGLDGTSAQGVLGQFGGTLEDVLAGRNSEAAMLLRRVGVDVHRNKDGTPDTARAFEDLADAIRRQPNPEAAGVLASRLGVTELLPLLQLGSKAIRQYGDEAERAGQILSDEGVKSLEAYARSLDRLQKALDGVKIRWTTGNAPWMTGAMDWVSEHMEHRRTWAQILGVPEDEGASGTPAVSASRRSSGVITGSWGGIRGNNPGNLRSAPGVRSVGGFAQFSNPMAGLQAMAAQIGRYGAGGINTVGGIVSKYAPPSENNTAAYIADVTKRTGFAAGQRLNLRDPAVMAPLLSAMVGHEQGSQPFGAADYRRAAETALQIEVVVRDEKTHVNVKSSDGRSVPARVAYAMPGSGVR